MEGRAPGRTKQGLQGLSSSTPDDGRAPGALPGLSELPSLPGCRPVLPAALFPSLLKAGPASSADFPRAGHAGPPAELSPRLAWTDLCSPPPHRGHGQPAGCVWELQVLWEGWAQGCPSHSQGSAQQDQCTPTLPPRTAYGPHLCPQGPVCSQERRPELTWYEHSGLCGRVFGGPPPHTQEYRGTHISPS